MIVDCHVHVNNYEDESVHALDRSIELLGRTMRRNRIDLALILTSYPVKPGRPSTRQVVEAVRDLPYLSVVAGLDFTSFHPGVLDELTDYVRDGKVRSAGVSNYNTHQFELLNSRMEQALVTNQLEFHLLHMDPILDGTFSQCERLGIFPMAWSPLAQGRLLKMTSAT